MVNFTIEDVREVMFNSPQNIRNVSVIAHVDHGKTTLTDTLLAGAGIIKYEDTGRCVTDTSEKEKEKGITIKSTGVSMVFALPVGKCLVNLIDSPGHVDFSGEVSAALRLSDGALVVVDIIEGVCIQTETVLRQALIEFAVPVLVLNKFDRLFLELQLSNEEIYLQITRVISSFNSVINTYANETYEVDPVKGQVVFAAGYQGWAFSIRQFAEMYAAQNPKLSVENLIKKFWGDNFYNPQTKKWSVTRTEGSERGFCYFILRPIAAVFQKAQEPNAKELLTETIAKLSLSIKPEEFDACQNARGLSKIVMQRWLPAHIAIVDMLYNRLPSPIEAQKVRAEHLYSGPMDDQTAISIKNCDPTGPLVVYIAKMIQSASSESRFLAYGRVFSGSARSGAKVRIIEPTHGQSQAIVCTMQRVHIVSVKKAEPVDVVPCGNIIAISGIDKNIYKTCTVTDQESSHPIVDMVHSVSAVVRVAVRPQLPKDLPKLVTAFKKLLQFDTIAQCTFSEETGEHILAAAGELHIQLCLSDLKAFAGCPLVVDDPVVPFRETVAAQSEILMVPTSNKLNKIFVSAQPLGNKLTEDIEANTFKIFTKESTSQEAVASRRTLAEKYDWDINDAKKIWICNPVTSGSNLVVDQTQGVQHMQSIKDSIGSGFTAVANEGVLCGEPLMGVRFNVVDCSIHSDNAHRGPSQIVPATRRVLRAAQMAATPKLVEPIFRLDVTATNDCTGSIYYVLERRRGKIANITYKEGTPLVTFTGHLPVAESFGVVEELRAKTGGKALPSLAFSHYEQLPGDINDPDDSLFKTTLKAIRVRKGLSPELPTVADLLA